MRLLHGIRDQEINGRKIFREADIIAKTLSAYRKSGNANYVRKIEKCEDYLVKILKDGRDRSYFFTTLLTINCKETIAEFDVNSDAADIFLAISDGMDAKLAADKFPYMRIPRRYLKFAACFFQAHELWCKFFVSSSCPCLKHIFIVPNVFEPLKFGCTFNLSNFDFVSMCK